MNFTNEMQLIREKINRSLVQCLEAYASSGLSRKEILEPMGYSLLAGGKRIRPLLLIGGCLAFSQEYEEAMPFACAIEMIHTYSLIHDDLPAMDNDDFRRGRLTCHKAFDEGLAILAGDALLNLAFEVMTEAASKDSSEKGVRQKLLAMHEISKASGAKGMIAGQAVDITSVNKRPSYDELEYMHKNKTGAIIGGAISAGALIGGADVEIAYSLRKLGITLGLAFQIQDDLLDLTSTKEEMGKAVNKDEALNKATYTSILGEATARERFNALSVEIFGLLEGLSLKNNLLIELIKNILNRKN